MAQSLCPAQGIGDLQSGSTRSSSEGAAITHNLHLLFQTHSVLQRFQSCSAFVIQSGPLQGKIGQRRN